MDFIIIDLELLRHLMLDTVGQQITDGTVERGDVLARTHAWAGGRLQQTPTHLTQVRYTSLVVTDSSGALA